ncbi:uncharacterized protein LOC134253412 [Saccostrea cucullata]|uniref:uncharacterized protein LOC134253412 n=1 Tax=Saccostrea cuccullata TaxID=36930 RepID=UPI002ED50C3A
MDKFRKSVCDKNMDTFRKKWNQSGYITSSDLNVVIRMVSEQGFVEGLRFIVKERGTECLNLGKDHDVFHVACKAEQTEVVKFLLALEEFDNTILLNSEFWNCLSKWSEANIIKVISKLLECGNVNINNTTIPPRRVSLLFHAIENRRKLLADYLIRQGADVTFVGKCDVLGTISCACLSAIQIPSLLPDLLKRGGNANDIYDESGLSVLMLAFRNDADRKTIEDIVRAGANLKWKDNSGKTTLSMLTSIDQLYGVMDAGVTVEEMEKTYNFATLDFIFYECDPFKDKDIFRIRRKVTSTDLEEGSPCEDAHRLLDLGAKPHNCLLSMMKIATNDDVWLKLGKRLFESGADPNETSAKGKSVISTAIKRNLVNLLELLLRHGANVNYMDSRHKTPLEYACQLCIIDREFRIVRKLLKYPVKWNEWNFVDHLQVVSVNAIAHSSWYSRSYHKLTYDLISVFDFFIAGADLMKERSGARLKQLARYGLIESTKFFMRCGWNIDSDREWFQNLENREEFGFGFNYDFIDYISQVTPEKYKSLAAMLNEILREPKSLQNLCRHKIRHELSFCGHSILPLIDDLPLPTKLKSFMKFEDLEGPGVEEVIVRSKCDFEEFEDS